MALRFIEGLPPPTAALLASHQLLSGRNIYRHTFPSSQRAVVLKVICRTIELIVKQEVDYIIRSGVPYSLVAYFNRVKFSISSLI